MRTRASIFRFTEYSVKHIPKLLSQIDGSNLVDNLDGSYSLSYLVTSWSMFKLFVQFAGTIIILSWTFIHYCCFAHHLENCPLVWLCLLVVLDIFTPPLSVDQSTPVDVPGSPFTIIVAPKPFVDASHSISSGIGLLQSVEGYTTAFEILLRDVYSNPISAQQVCGFIR